MTVAPAASRVGAIHCSPNDDVSLEHIASMTNRTRHRITLAAALALALATRCTLAASTEKADMLVGRKPLENVVVERDIVLRLHTELQLSEDDDELLDESISYKRFPKRISSSELRVFHASGLSFGGTSEYWENEQSFDSWRTGVFARIPITKSAKLRLQYSLLDTTVDAPKENCYLGISGNVTSNLYTYTRYRQTLDDGAAAGRQFYQYASWTPRKDVRIELQGAKYHAENDVASWHLRGSATKLFLADTTGVRLETEHSESNQAADYWEFEAYLYQRLMDKAWARLGYRFYTDQAHFNSHAYGVKLKYYVSSRFAAHVGYRQYDHSESSDFGTVFCGLSALF